MYALIVLITFSFVCLAGVFYLPFNYEYVTLSIVGFVGCLVMASKLRDKHKEYSLVFEAIGGLLMAVLVSKLFIELGVF